MKRQLPSIFNDVIGPVMRGPSSSHCAAALRIGRIAHDLMGASIKKAIVSFDPNGSLATTHQSQGSDMGLLGGFLGWEADDERLPGVEQHIKERDIQIEFEVRDIGAKHPNTYKILLQNENEQHTLTALSTGGGIIEIIDIDGFKIDFRGDCFATLIRLNSTDKKIEEFIGETIDFSSIELKGSGQSKWVFVRSLKSPGEKFKTAIKNRFQIEEIKIIRPVLPILAIQNTDIPFAGYEEMIDYYDKTQMSLWELALKYESTRAGISEKEVIKKMSEILNVMKKSIESGINGTVYKDRILGNQSNGFNERMKAGQLLNGGHINRMILYTTAIMEAKSAMQLIVAAPTAGSCGTLPGTIVAIAEEKGLSEIDQIRALLAAGLIGIFITRDATFAAESGGCQAECGSASGMAAAALVTLQGGTAKEAINAASMALQNSMGMTCDPVANRVEVPCLGKNIMAATNAFACANMAMSGYDPVIPLDQVIQTMSRVGKNMPFQLRCTALGGLSITEASRKIAEKLKNQIDKN